jgi:hypothetical protein
MCVTVSLLTSKESCCMNLHQECSDPRVSKNGFHLECSGPRVSKHGGLGLGGHRSRARRMGFHCGLIRG